MTWFPSLHVTPIILTHRGSTGEQEKKTYGRTRSSESTRDIWRPPQAALARNGSPSLFRYAPWTVGRVSCLQHGFSLALLLFSGLCSGPHDFCIAVSLLMPPFDTRCLCGFSPHNAIRSKADRNAFQRPSQSTTLRCFLLRSNFAFHEVLRQNKFIALPSRGVTLIYGHIEAHRVQ